MIPSDLHLQDSKVGCGKGGGDSKYARTDFVEGMNFYGQAPGASRI